ncbi:MAG TPA: FtsK/SpoIIIE domain-containing protein, partial [Mycobacterium sp.]|nr:FtsK/SpoIIIE domain-containing protein [Mycobacterium sp.]
MSDIHVEAPPAVPRRADAGLARLAPVVLGVASAGATLAILTSRSGAGHGPALIVFPLLMLLSAVAASMSGGAGRWRAELDADRRRYLRYLDSVWDRATEDTAAQHDQLLKRNPAPEDLWALPRQRWWERDRAAADFGAVRLGLGPVPPATRLVPPDGSGSGEQDPVTTAALARLVRAHESHADAPVTVGLADASAIVVTGPAQRARALVRAMICQLAVAHSPADVAVAAAVTGRAAGAWEWLKWLPHQPDRTESTDRLHLTVLDGADGAAPGPVIRIVPAESELVVEADGTAVPLSRPDELSAAGALALARRLAGHPRPHRPGDWMSRLDPDRLWHNDTGTVRGIPIGTGADGAQVELDIREAAAGGIGPHGLCVGATGSGKSELLRTIALGMIARHPPTTVNLILIDFKGGATFLDLARAPHTTAVVTNLDEEAHLVERMREALTGEIDRRERLLRAAGILSAADLPELPTLFIIVDEFSEMLSRHPEFADVFVAIGRLGRSLGMHLLLASQRLEEGRLRGLDSHLSYRICLKTLSESESRMVLGVPDAHHLPARPGAAYLKAAAAEPVPFHAGYVSAPVPSRPRTPAGPRLFTWHETPGADAAGPTLLHTVLDVVAHAWSADGPAPHPVWLAPLTETPALAALLPGSPAGVLGIPVGVVDRVYEHRRDPLVVDLSGADGNVAIVGGPRSGKSTAARTVVTALAATHRPRRARVYCLDFGGGLTDLAALPHVGVVAPGTDAERPDRLPRVLLR